MNHPIVFDRFETAFTGYGLAVLENVHRPRIFQKMNADYILDFFLPLDDPKREYMAEENFIRFNGQSYIIRTVTDERNERNEIMTYVYCEHVYYELYHKHIDELRFGNASPNVILDAILTGTRFTGSAAAMSSQHQFTTERNNAIWAMNHLLVLTRGEILRDNYHITMAPEIGTDRGVSFRYRKNLRSIKRTVDSSNVVTRVHVYGGDDENSVHVVVDSLLINQYPIVREGKLEVNGVTDPDTLRANGERYFSDRKMDVPRVSYECTVVELKAAIGYGLDEAIALGDTVTVYDEDLKIDVRARVLEYEEYPHNPESSRVVLSNFVDGIEDNIAALYDLQDRVDGFSSGRRLNTYWLDGVIDTLKNKLVASAAFQNAQVVDGGLLFELTNQTSADFGALYIGPGLLAIADSKLPNGDWNWRTFGTGKGFTADEINAGEIRTSLVKIFGDVNFYWDDTAIYMVDPSNQKQQVRIGKYDGTNYGIGFTKDGGSTWQNALDFNGLEIGPDTQYADGYNPNTALQTAEDAQSAAGNAQTTANQAKDKADNSVQQDTFYNRTRITPDNGVQVIDINNQERVKLADLGGGRYGILIRRPDGQLAVDVDSDGKFKIKYGEMEIEHANGSKTVIDGASFRVYPDKNKADHFIGVDGYGLYRAYGGVQTRFRDALAAGTGTLPQQYFGEYPWHGPLPLTPASTTTFDLIGGEWIGKQSSLNLQLVLTGHSAPYNDSGKFTALQVVRRIVLKSVTPLPNGLRVEVEGGIWFYYQTTLGHYAISDTDAEFSWMALG